MGSLRFIRLLLVLGCCLLICGCASKVNQANYDKIQQGMSEKEVQGILGSPTEQAGTSSNSGGSVAIGNLSLSAKSKVWKSGNKTITVMFLNDKVIGKASEGL